MKMFVLLAIAVPAILLSCAGERPQAPPPPKVEYRVIVEDVTQFPYYTLVAIDDTARGVTCYVTRFIERVSCVEIKPLLVELPTRKPRR